MKQLLTSKIVKRAFVHTTLPKATAAHPQAPTRLKLSFSPDGTHLATTYSKYATTLFLWTLQNAGAVIAPTGAIVFREPIEMISWHPNRTGLLLIVCSNSCSKDDSNPRKCSSPIYVWNAKWPVPVAISLPKHVSTVVDVVGAGWISECYSYSQNNFNYGVSFSLGTKGNGYECGNEDEDDEDNEDNIYEQTTEEDNNSMKDRLEGVPRILISSSSGRFAICYFDDREECEPEDEEDKVRRLIDGAEQLDWVECPTITNGAADDTFAMVDRNQRRIASVI